MQYIIYASKRLDGICAAAILARSLRRRSAKFKIGGFLNYFDIDKTLSEISQLKHSLIFFLDFSPEQIPNLNKKLEKISKNNRIAYWSSHHNCAQETIKTLKQFVKLVDFSKEEDRICGAELAQKKFLLHDTVANKLKDLARDIEFWINSDETSKKLSDLISAGFDLNELINLLSKGVFWSDKFEQILNDYNRKKTQALEWLMKKLIIKQYSNYNFGFSFSSSILTSADAGQFMLDSHDGVDVACIIFRNGKISFRRRDNLDLDLKQIAELFNGGGNKYASGGSLTSQFKQMNASNQDDVLFYIDRKLKEFLIN